MGVVWCFYSSQRSPPCNLCLFLDFDYDRMMVIVSFLIIALALWPLVHGAAHLTFLPPSLHFIIIVDVLVYVFIHLDEYCLLFHVLLKLVLLKMCLFPTLVITGEERLFFIRCAHVNLRGLCDNLQF